MNPANVTKAIRLAATFSLTSVIGIVSANSAIAQETRSSVTRASDGHVLVESGVFNFRTGELSNDSNVPLPTALPRVVTERVAVPHDVSQQAPNEVFVSIDEGELRRQVRELSGLEAGDYTAEVTGSINTAEDSHAFGEGAEMRDPDGNIQSAFVRGSSVTTGPNGEELSTSETMSAEFSNGEEVRVRILNLRPDSDEVFESGVYFDEAGNIITEDLPNGGIRNDDTDSEEREPDFDDGDIFDIEGGFLGAEFLEEDIEVSVEETLEAWEPPTSLYSTLLGIVDEEGNPTATNRFGIDTDGIVRYTHQLRPIGARNRPLIINGTFSVDPFTGNNEELLNLSLGAKQFITPTHRDNQISELGNVVSLLPSTTLAGNQDAAYNNTGGVVVVYTNGEREFVVQWTSDDAGNRYLNRALEFNTDEVSAFIPALIAEQPGSNQLQPGQFLRLVANDNGYTSEEGFNVISQDFLPQNFVPTVNEDHNRVEDTVATDNAAVEEFDGIRREGTVDFNDAIVSLLTEQPLVTTTERRANNFGLYAGVNASIGAGNQGQRTTTTTTTTATDGEAFFVISPNGMLELEGIETISQETFVDTDTDTSTDFGFSPLRVEGVFGGILYYGAQPAFTEAASNLRAELYAGEKSGVRAEVRQRLFGPSVSALQVNHRFGDGNDDSETTVVGGFTIGF